MNGIIETSTGDLLRWGESTFTLGNGESAAPTPLPTSPKRRFQTDETQMHRWDGSAWILVTMPLDPEVIEREAIVVKLKDGTATSADLMRYLVLRDEL